MSPKFNEPFKETIIPESKRSEPFSNTDRPVSIMTEKDAYISERIKAQPKSLEEIEVIPKEERLGIHRLSLPEYFEPFSYDCTMGQSCKYHGWASKEVMYGLEVKMTRWEQTKHGKFIFRWLSTVQRALDHSLNVRDWYIVNKTLFPDAPKILFSIDGGVRNGDAILGFMPVTKAILLRNKPSEVSQDRIASESIDERTGKRYEGHPNFYKAKLDPESSEGADDAPLDARQEGRDF